MKLLTALALAATAVSGSVSAQAQQPRAEGAAVIASAPGRAEAARVLKASATVTALDKASRTVTLKGPQGDEMQIVAGPEVRNFDQIEVGSQVVVGYVQALALELKKGAKGAPERVVSAATGRAPVGGTPGGAAAQRVTVTADVTALDPATRTVTLKGPKRTVDLRVPDPNQFKLIAVGDKVEATYTEALAITIEPAPKK